MRGAVGFGAQLGVANEGLRDVAQQYGPGLQLYVAVGPKSWPVLFGGQFDFIEYSGPTQTFTWEGETGDYQIGTLSHQGLAFVRLAPERFVLRPYLDVLGGYWLLNAQVRDYGPWLSDEEQNVSGIGARVVGAYGLRAGLGSNWSVGDPTRTSSH